MSNAFCAMEPLDTAALQVATLIERQGKMTARESPVELTAAVTPGKKAFGWQ